MTSYRVIHFEIQADDMERAKKFYEDTFGWRVTKMHSADKNVMRYWRVTTGSNGTEGIDGAIYKRGQNKLYTYGGKKKIYTYDCNVLVDNMDEAIKNIKSHGGKIVKEKNEIPGVGFLANILDTEGNCVGLMQPSEDWRMKKDQQA